MLSLRVDRRILKIGHEAGESDLKKVVVESKSVTLSEEDAQTRMRKTTRGDSFKVTSEIKKGGELVASAGDEATWTSELAPEAPEKAARK